MPRKAGYDRSYPVAAPRCVVAVCAMSELSPPSSAPRGRPFRSRLLRGFATSCGVVAAAAAGAYLSSHVAGPLHASPAADSSNPSSFPCDRDGVVVGYDLTYRSAFRSFAVDHVRVVGISSDCDGGPIDVALGDANGDAITGATASGVVSGSSVRLALAQPVPAAQVGLVEISIAGVTRSSGSGLSNPPATTTAPTTTVRATTAPTTTTVPPTVTVAAPPSLCATVSGFVSATGDPGNCGAVVAPPAKAKTTTSPGGKPAEAAAVVSWTQNVFTAPVTVSLVVPEQPVVPKANFSAGSFVQLEVKDSSGAPITQFPGVLALDFPPPSKDYVPLYSEDGVHWETIPKLPTNELPAGQPDGYYVHDDGSITILTHHATVWALAQPPTSVGRVKATPLPRGKVRLGWHGSIAGLGVKGYRIVRDGRLVATVRTTRTTVPLGKARSATFRVRAVDGAGQLGPWSPAVRVRARPVTAAGKVVVRRTGATVVVSTHVRLAGRARISVSVRAADGSALPLLAGSAVAGRRTRAGSTAAADARAGVAAIVLRLPARELRSGTAYTLRVGATVGRRAVPPLAEPFSAPGSP